MKKIKLFLIMAVMMLTAASAYSTCPTPPDFPGDPFIPGATTRTFQIGPNCWVTYEYCYRTAGGYFHDAYIGEITFSSNDCIGISTSMEQLLESCMIDLVGNADPWGALSSPESIPLCPAKTQSTWRLFNAPCYTDRYWDPYRHILVQSPCVQDAIGQCWQTWKFCYKWEIKDGVLQKVIHSFKSGRMPLGSTCTGLGGPNHDRPCTPVCEEEIFE